MQCYQPTSGPIAANIGSAAGRPPLGCPTMLHNEFGTLSRRPGHHRRLVPPGDERARRRFGRIAGQLVDGRSRKKLVLRSVLPNLRTSANFVFRVLHCNRIAPAEHGIGDRATLRRCGAPIEFLIFDIGACAQFVNVDAQAQIGESGQQRCAIQIQNTRIRNHSATEPNHPKRNFQNSAPRSGEMWPTL